MIEPNNIDAASSEEVVINEKYKNLAIHLRLIV